MSTRFTTTRQRRSPMSRFLLSAIKKKRTPEKRGAEKQCMSEIGSWNKGEQIITDLSPTHRAVNSGRRLLGRTLRKGKGRTSGKGMQEMFGTLNPRLNNSMTKGGANGDMVTKGGGRA